MSTAFRVAITCALAAMLFGMIACDLIFTVPGLTTINCILGLICGLVAGDLWSDA